VGEKRTRRILLHPQPEEEWLRTPRVRRDRPFAEIIAASDRTRRELRKAEREEEKDRQRRDREHLEALAAPVEELSEAAEILAHAHLVDAGFHRRKGEYRRARGER